MNTENAIVLLAGEGTRLLPLTAVLPKCLVKVRGRSILDNALERFAAAGVRDVHLVVGHLAEVVRGHVGDVCQGMRIVYVDNPDFRTTNSMYSLLLALRQVEGPTWVLEGDIFFDQDVLAMSPAVAGDIVWFGDSGIKDVGGAFLRADNSGRVTELAIIRDLSLLTPAHHKSVGALCLSATGCRQLLGWLETGLAAGKQNLYYDLIAAEHLAEAAIRLQDVRGKRWFEIDTPVDLARTEAIFA